ncbi:MAG: hypothetical protein Q8P91_00845 [bacterium]|nr:hypothetical protein [bacterium]
MERVTKDGAEAGKAFVNELYQAVINTGDESLRALEELSGIAMGGHEQARKLINKIDKKVSAGELILPRVNKPDKI